MSEQSMRAGRHQDGTPWQRDGAHTRFRQVQEAYDVLGDAVKREMYNRGNFGFQAGARSTQGAQYTGPYGNWSPRARSGWSNFRYQQQRYNRHGWLFNWASRMGRNMTRVDAYFHVGIAAALLGGTMLASNVGDGLWDYVNGGKLYKDMFPDSGWPPTPSQHEPPSRVRLHRAVPTPAGASYAARGFAEPDAPSSSRGGTVAALPPATSDHVTRPEIEAPAAKPADGLDRAPAVRANRPAVLRCAPAVARPGVGRDKESDAVHPEGPALASGGVPQQAGQHPVHLGARGTRGPAAAPAGPPLQGGEGGGRGGVGGVHSRPPNPSATPRAPPGGPAQDLLNLRSHETNGAPAAPALANPEAAPGKKANGSAVAGGPDVVAAGSAESGRESKP